MRAGTNRDELSVGLIPDSLIIGANSVVRNHQVTLDIKSPSETELTYHKVVTVLNEKAAGELSLYLFYNSFLHVGTMTASVYDKNGKLMNKHNRSDMTDYAASDGFSLYQDARVKFIHMSGGQYPVTIDYTYTLESNGTLHYPDFWIQDPHESIENETFKVNVSPGLGINYKAYNINLEPSISHEKDNDIYTWTVKGRKAISVPTGSYSASYYLPRIDLSPKKFEIAGYKGSLNTWKEFGASLCNAYKDKRKLTETEKSEVKKLVKDARTDQEKAEILYSYLQHNFRYVSIQIGIGGQIPFSAGSVDSSKYGDCKALSNYMCAMLNTVGIEAYPTLINAGSDLHPIDTTFPSSRFNHCILYAQIDNKPTWMECTSNSMPFGELGSFTENRYGLMLTDDGGKIINTPRSKAELNTMNVYNEVNISADSKAKISGSIDLSGEYRHGAKSEVILGAKKEQENYIFNHLNLKQSENIEVLHTKDTAKVISFDMTGESSKVYDFNTGGKSFLSSTYLKKWYDNISADSSRKHDLLLGFPHIQNEKLVYILNDSGKISLPSDFELENPLISFHRKSTKTSDNRIVIETAFVQKKHIIAPGEINLLKESLQKINKYIQQKLIIER